MKIVISIYDMRDYGMIINLVSTHKSGNYTVQSLNTYIRVLSVNHIRKGERIKPRDYLYDTLRVLAS